MWLGHHSRLHLMHGVAGRWRPDALTQARRSQPPRVQDASYRNRRNIIMKGVGDPAAASAAASWGQSSAGPPEVLAKGLGRPGSG